VNPFVPSWSSEGISRRRLLRTGGVVSLGAVVAACGSNRGGSDAPGRLGVAPPPATLPEAEVDDLALLRTAQSLEHTALMLHQTIIDTGALTADEMPLVERLMADHTAHADLFAGLVTGAGGQSFDCANPFLVDRVVNPIVEQFGSSDDVHRDVLLAAQATESWLGASHQSLVGQLEVGELRRGVAQVGCEEHRHATVLARLINPDDTFSPVFFGDPLERNGEGFWIPYAIPSQFGRVSGIDLVVGAPNDEGGRFSIQLQTPAPNSIVYDYQSC
jgi:hypothetical protein